MNKTYKDYIVDVLKQNNLGLHVSQIAQGMQAFLQSSSQEELKTKISSVIAGDIKKHKSKSVFRHVKNKKTKRNMKGYYSLKPEKRTYPGTIAKKLRQSDFVKSADEPVSTNQTGKAGEFAVISELLYRGYNAGIMAVDEGIDVIATKDNKTFYIQVKTHTYKNSSLRLTFEFDAYNKNAKFNIFYIIVIRYKPKKELHKSEFLVFHPVMFENLCREEISNKQKLTLKIEIIGSDFMVNGLKGNHFLNDFASLK